MGNDVGCEGKGVYCTYYRELLLRYDRPSWVYSWRGGQRCIRLRTMVQLRYETKSAGAAPLSLLLLSTEGPRNRIDFGWKNNQTPSVS